MSDAAPRPGWRVALAGALLGSALTLPLALVFADTEERVRSSVLTLGAFELGLLWGILAAWRLPAAPGAWRRALPHELAHGLALAVTLWAGVSLARLVALLWAPPADALRDPWAPLLIPIAIGGFAALFALASYLACRGITRAWAAWSRLRRRQLRWALTHAVLVVSLVLAVVAGVLLTAADIGGNAATADPFGFRTEQLGPAQMALALLILRYIPSALALFVVSVLAGLVIVPPIAAIAFPVVGRATGRLEALSAATAALRRGDLDARSPVAGEDEIARLQADFNAMAVDMQRAQEALRAERDAVAALLDNRRELVAAVSHELRTPLATLQGYLDSALAQGTDAPPLTLRHDLQIMRQESERLSHLIEDLFALSRAEIGRLPLDLQPTDVPSLLRRIAEAAAPLAWERGRVEVLAQDSSDLAPALVDPARLEQAVRNLVTNAVRHTPPGGLVLLAAASEGDHLIVRVRDTGEGIAADDLPHIWDRFFRADRAAERQHEQSPQREGSGLGLALVKELIEAMGGAVAVDSVPGQGSCFSLFLLLATSGHEAMPRQKT